MGKREKSKDYSHVLKYTGLFGGVQGVNILVGIARNKLVAEILGPAGMGLISLFNSTINLISNSTNLGISMSAVKSISEAYDNKDEEKMRRIISMVRAWSILTAVAGMALCIFLSPWLSRWTFGWGNHTLHFIFLSPVVAILALTGGEMSILKGMRRLRALAKISVYNVVAALFTSVPLYFFFGEAAIVPSLLVMALTQMLLTIGFSWKMFPFENPFGKGVIGKGMGMVKLGVAFVLAGILGSGADFLIRSFLSYNSSLETVGLYSAGYMMTMTYASMVFSAMETDFFPRLSANHHLVTTTNTIVNRQIEVSLLLVAPMLVFFIIGVPILLPLLYSGKFTPVIGMVQITVFAIFIRAIKLPMAYLPLAKGDSRSYLLLEGIYDILLVIAVVLAFLQWGLLGCGIAITIVGFLDFLIILFYTKYKYGYRMSVNVKTYALMQLPFCVLAYGVVAFVHNQWVYWILGVLLGCASLFLSVHILRQKTRLWQSIKNRFNRRFRHA